MAQYAVSYLLESFAIGAIILAFLAFSALSLKVFRAKLRYMVWLVILNGLLIPLNYIINTGMPVQIDLTREPAGVYPATANNNRTVSPFILGIKNRNKANNDDRRKYL